MRQHIAEYGSNGWLEKDTQHHLKRVALGMLPNASDVSIVSSLSSNVTASYADLLRSHGADRRVRVVASNIYDDDKSRIQLQPLEQFCFLVKAKHILVGPTGSHDFFWAATLGQASRIRFYHANSSSPASGGGKTGTPTAAFGSLAKH
jgi:hypothetical protein